MKIQYIVRLTSEPSDGEPATYLGPWLTIEIVEKTLKKYGFTEEQDLVWTRKIEAPKPRIQTITVIKLIPSF